MKKIFAVTCIALSAITAFSLCSCAVEGLNSQISGGNSGGSGGGTQTEYSSLRATYSKFNTTASLVVTDNFNLQENNDKLRSLSDEVKAYLNQLENSLSTSVSTSCISRFNAAEAGETIEIDSLTYEVLSLAIDCYELTGGYYNPAVYYSVDLYGFTPRFNEYTGYADISTRMPYDRVVNVGNTKYVTRGTEPDEYYVAIFRDLASHFGEIQIGQNEDSYYVIKPQYTVQGLEGEEYSLALDLGGIGKGYAVDKVNAMMSEYGFEYGYFEFGRSSYAIKGSRDQSTNGQWNMSISDPYTMGYSSFASIMLSSVCLSTSGDYEKAYSVGDTTYCHIINPMTGMPIQTRVASCTVIGRTAAQDDAITTAISAMGKERAVEFINDNLTDMKVVIMMRNADGTCTDIITNCAGELTVLSGAIINTVEDGKIVL